MAAWFIIKKVNVMKRFLIFSFSVMSLLICPGLTYTQVSPDAIKAFREVNVRVLEQRVAPADFSLPSLNGESVALSSYKGSVVILNFWATWCPPCRAEMPSMETLYKRFQNQGLTILAVDLGETAAAVRQFIKNNNYTFPVLLDLKSNVGSLYGVRAIPASYIIDREGKIIASIMGSIQWDTPGMIAAFDALLKSR